MKSHQVIDWLAEFAADTLPGYVRILPEDSRPNEVFPGRRACWPSCPSRLSRGYGPKSARRMADIGAFG